MSFSFLVHQTREFSILSHSIFQFFEQDGSRRVKNIYTGVAFLRDAGYSRLLVGVPFFSCFSYLLLPRVTDPDEPGGCWIAMRSCRHRPWPFPRLFPAFCCYFFCLLHLRPLIQKKLSIFFQVFLIWISAKHTTSCWQRNGTQRNATPLSRYGVWAFLHVFPGFGS